MRHALCLLCFLAACGGESEPEAAEGPPEAPTDEVAEAEEPPSEAQPAEPEREAPPDVWVLRSEGELRETIQSALARARERDARVLLEFGADWCPDCNEVARLGEREPAKDVIDEKYERVFIHVGRFDRHRDLLQRYRVERIATLVVLEADGRRVAQTTLEPISNRSGLTPAALAAWLREPVDQWEPPERNPGAPRPDDSPLFPAEVVGSGS